MRDGFLRGQLQIDDVALFYVFESESELDLEGVKE
jgi:hypothetical protein